MDKMGIAFSCLFSPHNCSTKANSYSIEIPGVSADTVIEQVRIQGSEISNRCLAVMIITLTDRSRLEIHFNIKEYSAINTLTREQKEKLPV